MSYISAAGMAVAGVVGIFTLRPVGAEREVQPDSEIAQRSNGLGTQFLKGRQLPGACVHDLEAPLRVEEMRNFVGDGSAYREQGKREGVTVATIHPEALGTMWWYGVRLGLELAGSLGDGSLIHSDKAPLLLWRGDEPCRRVDAFSD